MAMTTTTQKPSIAIGYAAAPLTRLRISRCRWRYSATSWSIFPIVPDASEAFIIATKSFPKIFGYLFSADEKSTPPLTCSARSVTTTRKPSESTCSAMQSSASGSGTPVSTITANWLAKKITSSWLACAFFVRLVPANTVDSSCSRRSMMMLPSLRSRLEASDRSAAINVPLPVMPLLSLI